MSKNKLTILTFSGFYIPGYKGGGPIKTIKNLVDQTSPTLNLKIVTRNHDLGGSTAYKGIISGSWNEVGPAKVFYTDRNLAGLRQIIKIIFQEKYDIIYLNSFFSFRFSILPQLMAKPLRKKVVLGPRGEFSAGALNLKASKKNIFLAIYKFLKIHENVVYQASSEYEKDDIYSALGTDVSIYVAENIGAQEFAQTLPIRSTQTLKMVFLSRISPMKNLSGALKILSFVKLPVTYHIYGPIEDEAYWQDCLKLIDALPEHIEVSYKGELTPSEVVQKLSLYDLFFLPTHGENYGHVIAEALCAGLPILITNTTPWRHLKEQGIGWDLPIDDLEAFVNVIETASLMPVGKHVQMRQTVLSWAKKKFSQQDAIKANIKLFKNALKETINS